MPANLCLEVVDNTTFLVNEIESAGATDLVNLWGTNNAMPAGPTPRATTGEFEIMGTTFTATGTAGQYRADIAPSEYDEPLPQNMGNLCAIKINDVYYLGALNQNGVPFLIYYETIDGSFAYIFGAENNGEIVFDIANSPDVTAEQCEDPNYATAYANSVFIDFTSVRAKLPYRNQVEVIQTLACEVDLGMPSPYGDVSYGGNILAIYGDGNLSTNKVFE